MTSRFNRNVDEKLDYKRSYMRVILLAIAVCVSATSAVAQSNSKTLNSYNHVLTYAGDWEKIPWEQQVYISREFFGGVDKSTEFDACMDYFSSDIRFQSVPFAALLRKCIECAAEVRC